MDCSDVKENEVFYCRLVIYFYVVLLKSDFNFLIFVMDVKWSSNETFSSLSIHMKAETTHMTNNRLLKGM